MQDTMDLLGDLTPADAKQDKPIFLKNEKVEFVCKEAKVLEKNQILLSCTILTGQHAGKAYSIFIPDASNDVRRKQRAAFFWESGFWKEDELKSKQFSITRCAGRKFCAVAGEAKQGKQGGTFQDITGIRDLGASAAGAVAGAVPAGAAAAASFT